ncbi:MAG: type II secretion system F family protein [Anaerovoracaceae bacterium]
MPTYEYTAAESSGKKVKSKEQSRDIQTLRNSLKDKGLYMLKCNEVNDKKPIKPLKGKDLAEFCRDLGMMIGTGIPLVRAISIMAERDIAPRMKQIYRDLHRDLQQGIMLSQAMENQAPAFPEMLVSMYKTSESTGGMDKTSEKMALHYEKSHKLNQKLKSAMIYPMTLLVVSGLVVLVVFLGILPKFFALYEDLDVPLPGITQFMLNISVTMQKNWIVILVGILIIILVVQSIFKLPKVKTAWDEQKLKLPIVGKLLKVIYTSRFASTLSYSYSSGISIVNALVNTQDTIGNVYVANQFDELVKDIRNGMALSGAVGKVKGLDGKLAASILVGEETGRLDTMLDSIAETFEYDSEIALQRMTALIEPVMIIVMAIIIGTIMISVMLPIPTLYNAIGGGA